MSLSSIHGGPGTDPDRTHRDRISVLVPSLVRDRGLGRLVLGPVPSLVRDRGLGRLVLGPVPSPDPAQGSDRPVRVQVRDLAAPVAGVVMVPAAVLAVPVAGVRAAAAGADDF